jgi:hypothetical protein
MTCPQCPQIKSSPPVPDIRLSVRKIERFSVVTGPTGIMGMVAILSPACDGPRDSLNRKQSPINPPPSHATFLPRQRGGCENLLAPLACDWARTGPLCVERDRGFADSLLEGNGFEPSVPRKAPGVVVVSVLVRANFSIGRKIEQRRHEPLWKPWSSTRYRTNPIGLRSEAGSRLMCPVLLQTGYYSDEEDRNVATVPSKLLLFTGLAI